MIKGIRIGQAHHKPNGEVLYPVYYEGEFHKTETLYVEENQMNQLKNYLEFLFVSLKKRIPTRIDVG